MKDKIDSVRICISSVISNLNASITEKGELETSDKYRFTILYKLPNHSSIIEHSIKIKGNKISFYVKFEQNLIREQSDFKVYLESMQAVEKINSFIMKKE